jgi:hypothetical protein
MPPAADDPHSDRTGSDRPEAPFAAPSADAPAADAPAPAQDGTSPIAAGGDSAESEAVPGGEPHRRRRRRRRGPPRELGPASPGPAGAQEAAGEGRGSAAATAEATSTEPWAGHQASSDTASGDQAATQPTADAGAPHDGDLGDRPRRRRRRRRRPPPSAPTAAPGGLGSALPAADTAATEAEADSGAAEDAGAGGADAEPSSGRGVLRLRRPVRGRRQLPRPPGLQRGLVQPAPSEAGDLPTSGAAVADNNGAATSRPEGEFPRRRRRRRPPPRPSEAGPTGEAQSAAAAPRQANRPPRSRGGYRGPGESRTDGARQQHERGGEAQARGPGPGPREREPGAPVLRERSDGTARGRPGGQRGGEQRGRRGRDATPRQVVQKLYALEAMVDRGFEDVPDEAEESGSRRVHWTIVKRTVADQKSGKAMSASYVLQREGGETEFPNLGAARAAANKTIIHPEKLTMSKAEHAAAKNSK